MDCGVFAAVSETLSVAFLVPRTDGENETPTSHAEVALSTNTVVNEQAGFEPAAENTWKSPEFAPVMANEVPVTLMEEVPTLNSVAIIVPLVVPTGTGPKFTGLGVKMAKERLEGSRPTI